MNSPENISHVRPAASQVPRKCLDPLLLSVGTLRSLRCHLLELREEVGWEQHSLGASPLVTHSVALVGMSQPTGCWSKAACRVEAFLAVGRKETCLDREILRVWAG